MIRYFLTTVMIFVAAKIVFMVACNGNSTVSIADGWNVICHGLSLDLSTALYFIILPFLLSAVSIFWSGRTLTVILRVYTLVISIAFALAFIADSSLYPFWQSKLDSTWLQYLQTPTEAMASVNTSYLIIRFGLMVAVTWLIYKAYGSKRINWEKEKKTRRQFIALTIYVLLIPAIIIGIRGGVSESTTNTGQVYFSQKQFLNHAAVNPLFSLFYSIGLQPDDYLQYTFFDTEESKELVKDIYTTESIGSDTLLKTHLPHIVIILLESAGEQFASAMPHLQELKREGVNFSRCYANSWRTDRGTVAILSGYPTFPLVSIMKIPEKSNRLPSIATSLKGQGYATSFLYGGDIDFTNMRSYLIGTGWGELTTMDDFSLKEQHSAQWGVRDDITFQRLYENICNSDTTRHLWGFSTLSSHEPWDVPPVDFLKGEKTEGQDERCAFWKENSDKVLNAFAYLDYCLYDFVSRLKKTPQWENLLIVLTADHGIIHGQIDNTTPQEKNHIPMVWLGGAIREPRTVSTLCNQSDLAATLLGQLGLNHDEYAFSRDVLSKSYSYPTAVNNYKNAQWVTDSTGHILYDFDAGRIILRQSPQADRLLRVNKAIIQETTNDYINL